MSGDPRRRRAAQLRDHVVAALGKAREDGIAGLSAESIWWKVHDKFAGSHVRTTEVWYALRVLRKAGLIRNRHRLIWELCS